jgi:hypothetical protein
MNGIPKGGASGCAFDSLLYGLRVIFIANDSRAAMSARVFQQYGAETLVIAAHPSAASKAVLAIDVQSKAGREVLRRIVRTADVLIVQLEMGSAAFRHLDVQSFEEFNPGLVTVLSADEAQARRLTQGSATDACLSQDTREVVSALAGLWYRDRRNGAGISIGPVREESRPLPGGAENGARNGSGYELDARGMLLSVDFMPDEIDALIHERRIAFGSGE